MHRVRVESSNVHSIGHDPHTKTLEVAFWNRAKDGIGSIYHYDGVPSELAAALMGAPSKGLFLNLHIKNVYRHRKVG